MGKTRSQLEADASAVVKQVLTTMEDLAALPPAEAADPYRFEERRRQVMRSIWGLFKGAMAYDPSTG